MIKNANCIIVGGPIAVGKSSLVEKLPFIGIQELNDDDKFQNLLLEKLYKGDKLASQILQFDMLLTRFRKYEELADQEKIHVFDRSIFEDSLFAKFLIEDVDTRNFYQAIWKDCVNKIVTNIGTPRLYIFLDCSWSTFKKRLFKRNRTIEISNFENNEKYFKKLLRAYKHHMISIFKKYKIEHLIINTNYKTTKQIRDIVITELSIRGIGDEIK